MVKVKSITKSLLLDFLSEDKDSTNIPGVKIYPLTKEDEQIAGLLKTREKLQSQMADAGSRWFGRGNIDKAKYGGAIDEIDKQIVNIISKERSEYNKSGISGYYDKMAERNIAQANFLENDKASKERLAVVDANIDSNARRKSE